MTAPDLESLIADAKAEPAPDADAQAQAWARLEGAVATGAAPSADGALPDATAPLAKGLAGGGLGLGKLVIAGTVVFGSVGVGAVAMRADDDPTAETIAADDVSQPESPTDTKPAADLEEEPRAQPVPPSAEPPRAEAPSHRAKARRPRRAKPPTSDLAADSRLLGQAWAAVGDGNNHSALALLKDHRRRFPDSPLANDRRACELVAKCQRNDPNAVKRANAFLARHSGISAQRVADACGTDPKPDDAR